MVTLVFKQVSDTTLSPSHKKHSPFFGCPKFRHYQLLEYTRKLYNANVVLHSTYLSLTPIIIFILYTSNLTSYLHVISVFRNKVFR